MTTRPAKTQRQYRIKNLLETHAVSSQGQLVELLAAEGIDATQTTVSRDLEDIGIRQAGKRHAAHVRLSESHP